jgi:transcriptional regulator with XRE-family HTH domain
LISLFDDEGLMAEGDSPTVARRRVRLALREKREAVGLTQQQVADEMEWSFSKVIRIEGGDVSIAPNDLRPLMAYLGIKDRAQVSELMSDAKIARTRHRRAWWQAPEYREHLTDPPCRLIEFEAEAAAIRFYPFHHLSGTLQIPAYARALSGKWDDELTEEQVKCRVNARRLRQETLLSRLEHVKLCILLDESMLWRSLGGTEVLAQQVDFFVNIIVKGQVSVREIPFAVDTSMTKNASFGLLFLGEDLPENAVLYRENGLTDEIVEDQSITSRHRNRFDRVWRASDDEATTPAFIPERLHVLRLPVNSRSGDVL